MKKNKKQKKSSRHIFPMSEKVSYSTNEAAALIGTTVYAVRQYTYLKILKPIKEGRRCLYLHSDLISWMLLGRPTSKERLITVNTRGRLVPMIPKNLPGVN
jgi:hypothetical protein